MVKAVVRSSAKRTLAARCRPSASNNRGAKKGKGETSTSLMGSNSREKSYTANKMA